MDFIPSNHPLTPPHTAEDLSVSLRLLRSRRVGISTFHRLIREHGSAATALEALPDIARSSGVSDYHICPEGVIDAELTAGRRFGAQLVAMGEPQYPALLGLIEDAPPLIWMKGDTSLIERPMIALVGARYASSIALRMTRAITRDLGSEGFAVVAGLTRGVESCAHEIAVGTGTVAVLAGGLDVVDPIENRPLYKTLSHEGLLISEHPFGLKPLTRHYAQRSRLISGIALATLVIEASAKSGALNAATSALEQGREVMAVPGHPFDGRVAGCNNLLRDGAGLLRGARDVIDTLANARPLISKEAGDVALTEPEGLSEILAQTPPPPETRSLSDHAALHTQILGRLGPAPISEDQLIRDLGARADQVSAELLSLELDGKVKRRSGGLLALS